ncbi:MAG TPA: protein translocase subunit SecF [Mycobacteriales bacterium]|nr:protein translocase subunit SecF [Mycobacteriales bacterium]
MGLVHRLYHGETAFPLIKERKRFYGVSILLCVIALGSLLFQGLNLGVEFKGGAIFTVSAPSNVDVHASRTFVEGLGVKEAIVQTVKTSGGQTKLRVETEPLTKEQEDRVVQALADRFHVDANTEIDSRDVGASWGKQVTRKALNGLVAFLIGVTLFISIRFEPKMAAASMVALVHDLLLAAGIYSITQFVVTPSTIIALLTVLGYSLYDTIVVFDRVDENTKGIERGNKATYSEAAELAVNQTFMRSINTSMIALLPVSGLLFVGALLLGAGTLKDLALALFVGLASGAYSSLFLATPLLADLKEREPRFQALQGRVAQRRAGAAAPVRLSQRSVNAPEDAPAPEGDTETPAPATTTATAVRRNPPPRKKKGGRSSRPSGKRKR